MKADMAMGDDQMVVDEALNEFVYQKELAPRGASLSWQPLTGGVSSDIWRLEMPTGTICVKRALAKLKVKADWNAPISRNAYEWEWMKFAAQQVPDSIPQLLAHDPEKGVFAMEFLNPDDYPVWKSQLMAGQVDAAVAAKVGGVLAHIHAASANSSELESRFDTYDNFYDLRLEPYLLATVDKHPDLKAILTGLSEKTGAARIALVHGDVSPKNILIGPGGPVFLDAECAWYGDPAFDLAFCLNHLLLKCLVNPVLLESYLESYNALTTSYMDGCDWEPAIGIEARAAALLPALLLARIDGKSPVEYIVEDVQRDLVRHVAKILLKQPKANLADIAVQWKTSVKQL